ncbi:MAG: hypothetical protein MMC23_006159 [Stictis urceolatum]|nr:hypothetical protein [Stictis urceolata]
MSVRQAFSLITWNGRLALQRDDLGVIREGATADLVIFSTDPPAFLGYSNRITAIILHTNAGDVEHVLIHGENQLLIV